MKVDAPPNKKENEDRPFLLTIGPMLTMSMTSFVSMFSTLNAITNGETTWKNARPQLIICGAMIASVFIWPLLTKWYTKFDNMKKERKRQKKYRRYIDEKKFEIKEAIKVQTDTLKRSNETTKSIVDSNAAHLRNKVASLNKFLQQLSPKEREAQKERIQNMISSLRMRNETARKRLEEKKKNTNESIRSDYKQKYETELEKIKKEHGKSSGSGSSGSSKVTRYVKRNWKS